MSGLADSAQKRFSVKLYDVPVLRANAKHYVLVRMSGAIGWRAIS
jgi:hypothetical protein